MFARGGWAPRIVFLSNESNVLRVMVVWMWEWRVVLSGRGGGNPGSLGSTWREWCGGDGIFWEDEWELGGGGGGGVKGWMWMCRCGFLSYACVV